jgi:hypothetical protein
LVKVDSVGTALRGDVELGPQRLKRSNPRGAGDKMHAPTLCRDRIEDRQQHNDIAETVAARDGDG